MTKTQAALIDAIKAAVAGGTWEQIPSLDGLTVRYAERGLATPEMYAKNSRYWGSPTYDRLLFITIVAGKKWSIIYRHARAPWVEARDMTVTFKRAFEILANPAEEFAPRKLDAA